MLRSKKTVIYPKSHDEGWSEYDLIASLHHQKINHPERINNLKPFAVKYNREISNFQQNQKIWKIL